MEGTVTTTQRDLATRRDMHLFFAYQTGEIKESEQNTQPATTNICKELHRKSLPTDVEPLPVVRTHKHK